MSIEGTLVPILVIGIGYWYVYKRFTEPPSQTSETPKPMQKPRPPSVSMEKHFEKPRNEDGWVDTFDVHQCLFGLPKMDKPAKLLISCYVNDTDFIFREPVREGKNVVWNEFGSIPRNSIAGVCMEDKSAISSRFTVTRLAAMGPLGLALPKTTKRVSLCVLLDWYDKKGERQNTVFEFTQQNFWERDATIRSANMAYRKFQEYKRPFVERLAKDEKKCPYCAETIKKEAKLCRYCQSQLE